jgi:PAS domain S-box-containing protein
MLQANSTSLQKPLNFQAAFECLPGMHMLLQPNHPDFTILAISDDLVRLADRKREAIIGSKIFEVFPPVPDSRLDGTSILAASLLHVIEHKEAHHLPVQRYDIRNEHGALEEHYWSILNKPILDEEGNLLFILHSTEDITQRIIAGKREASLKGLETAYHLFMQAPLNICIVKGTSNVIEMANEATLKLWGKTNDIIGVPLFDAIPALKSKLVTDILDQVRKTGKPFQTFEMPVDFHKDENDEVHYLNSVYQPYYESGNKKPAGVFMISNDVTEQVLSKKKAEESEEQFRTMANSISQLAWIANSEGWIYWYNDRWYEYTGTTLDEMQGWGWEKVHHPDHIQRVVSIVKEAWVKGEPFELTFPLRSKNGYYRWFLTRTYPVRNAEGKVVQWIGTNTDIDEYKQNELLLGDRVEARTRELESQRNLFDNILKNSSNGISVTEMVRDEAGNIIDARTILANEAAVLFTGLPKDIYLNTTAKQLDPNILESPYGLSCLQTLKTGVPAVSQYFLEATGRWLELTISKMDDDHLIHIFTDVTPIKEAQIQLERTVAELKSSNVNLEEFAYAASHDLKEPIRKIGYFAGRLLSEASENLRADQVKFIERMNSAARRSSDLIDDLLTYSYFSKGLSDEQDIDLNMVVQTVLEDLELKIQDKQAKISLEKLPKIQGNERQLNQLFQNLIENALKYSKPEEPPRITIQSKQVNAADYAHIFPSEYCVVCNLIEVKDNGIGFESKDAARIFNVFTRLHGKSEFEGTGIGLSIVHKVVTNHKGAIWAESELGSGAMFKMLFPVR